MLVPNLLKSEMIRALVENDDYAAALYSLLQGWSFRHDDPSIPVSDFTQDEAGGVVAMIRERGEDHLDYKLNPEADYSNEPARREEFLDLFDETGWWIP